jgi:hypothetical protein
MKSMESMQRDAKGEEGERKDSTENGLRVACSSNGYFHASRKFPTTCRPSADRRVLAHGEWVLAHGEWVSRRCAVVEIRICRWMQNEESRGGGGEKTEYAIDTLSP